MAPMFCTKLFNWGKTGKNKKEGGSRPPLDAVFPEPQDEGEACPYWTHVQCNPPASNSSSRPHTPTHAPLLPAHHPGSPVHHQPGPCSPVAHRRAAHVRSHQVKCGHEVAFCSTTYSSPYHSPHHSSGPNSPISHSPVHFTPIHHPSTHCSPVPHTPGFHSPVHITSGYNSPVHHTPGFNSPVHHTPGFNSPVHHTPGFNSPVHHASGYNSPVHHAPGFNSPVHHASGYNSPVHHASGYNSPVHHASGYNSPVHHASGYNSPVQVQVQAPPPAPGNNNQLHLRGYVLESTYCQPLPPPPPQRPPPPIPGLEGSQLKSATSASSSRSTSPANGSSSFIPQPRGHGGRASLSEKHSKTSGTSNLARTSLRGATNQQPPHNPTANHVHTSPYHAAPVVPPTKHKDSMLDKFKLFNHKEKDGRNKTTSSSGVSKRTSSSSGFSSARSERSDSSTSVCSDAKPPPLPPHQSLPVSTSSSSSDQTSHADAQQGGAPPPAKPQGLRGIRSKFSKSSGKEGKESPKSSRKDKEREEREGSRGSPRGGHKAHRDPRAERGDSRERSGREERGGKKSEKLTLELDGGSRSRPQHAPPTQADLVKEQRMAALAPRPDTTGHSTEPQLPPALPPKENHYRDHGPILQPEQLLTAMQQQQQSADHGLASTPGSPLLPGTPGTGIPKPTAHVKGQTKAVPPERTGPTTPTTSPNVNTPQLAKDYNKMVRHPPGVSSPKVAGAGSGAPRAAVTPAGPDVSTAPESRDPKGSLPRQKQLGRREDSATGISVALVSPMPNPREKDLVTPSESGSNISESSQSNSGHSNSNSSGNSSVIYKPTSSEDGSVSDFKTHIGKVDERNEAEEGDEVILNIKPMQPLVRASQYGYMRGLGLHQARTVPPSLHVSRLALQDNANTVPQKGMRLGPHLKRPPGSNQVMDADYSDLDSVELTNGYMSDGDVLRNVGYKSANSSDLDGYLSEGGASLYAHRLNQRFKEGMRQVHESMNKVQHFIQDDSFDDSSSLSSGVSDTLNEMSAEDVLSSSLSSDHPAYAKGRSMKEVGLKLPVGLSGSSSRKVAMGVDPSGMYKVVSSRAHVKKTESSQQTDNSAFK